jgi:hypothetical protein
MTKIQTKKVPVRPGAKKPRFRRRPPPVQLFEKDSEKSLSSIFDSLILSTDQTSSSDRPDMTWILGEFNGDQSLMRIHDGNKEDEESRDDVDHEYFKPR